MLRKLFVSLFLQLYRAYSLTLYCFFSIFGPIWLIYYLDEGKIKNITPHYYLKLGLDNYHHGKFFIKTINHHRTDYFSHHGHINNIPKRFIVPNETKKRKNIILVKDGNPVNIDLAIIDNYFHNMKNFEGHYFRELKHILLLLGKSCSDVHIISMKPFKKETHNVNSVLIDYFYH